MANRYAVQRQRRGGLFARWETLWTANADEPVYVGRRDGKVDNAGRTGDLVGRKLWDYNAVSMRRHRMRVVAV